MKNRSTLFFSLALFCFSFSFHRPKAQHEVRFQFHGMPGESVFSQGDKGLPLGLSFDYAVNIGKSPIAVGARIEGFTYGREKWEAFYSGPNSAGEHGYYDRRNGVLDLELLIRGEAKTPLEWLHPYAEITGGRSRRTTHLVISPEHPGGEDCPAPLYSEMIAVDRTYTYGIGGGLSMSFFPNDPCSDVLRLNIGAEYKVAGPAKVLAPDEGEFRMVSMRGPRIRFGLAFNFNGEKLEGCASCDSSDDDWDWDDDDDDDWSSSGCN